jgi:hypothetical protein
MNAQTYNAKVGSILAANDFNYDNLGTHQTLEAALCGLNLCTFNSGWYNPKVARIEGKEGYYFVNQDGTINFSFRVIKTNEGYQNQELTSQSYIKFEQLFCAA